MKKLMILLSAVMFVMTSFAQSRISYSGFVAVNGNAVANEIVDIEISILKEGAIIFKDNVSIPTTETGMVNFMFAEDTMIDWSHGKFETAVSISLPNGIIEGSASIGDVPIAQYARLSKHAVTADSVAGIDFSSFAEIGDIDLTLNHVQVLQDSIELLLDKTKKQQLNSDLIIATLQEHQIHLPNSNPSGAPLVNPDSIYFKDRWYPTIEFAGNIWFQMNLGAERVATSLTDTAAAGYYFQFDRAADGHEIPGSERLLYSQVGPCEQPNDNKFRVPDANWNTSSATSCNQWHNPYTVYEENVNICPTGYHVATQNDWEEAFKIIEYHAYDSDLLALFTSPLKLMPAGYRQRSNAAAERYRFGLWGCYWCLEAKNATSANAARFSTYVHIGSADKAEGLSIRCVKDQEIE